MTSQRSSLHNISFKDLQTEITKRHIWIPALTILAFFSYYILGTILVLFMARKNYILYDISYRMTLREYMISAASGWIGPTSYSFLITAGIALLAGFTSFAFLYKTQSVDFYLSHPITRRDLFLNICVNPVMVFAALAFVFRMIGLLISLFMGAVSGQVIGGMLIEYLLNLLLYITVYTITVLAVLVSKNMMIAVITDFILLAGKPLIGMLFTSMMSSYYATYRDISWMIDAPDKYRPDFISSIANHIHMIGIFNYNEYAEKPLMSGTAGFILASVLLGVVAIVLSYLAFMKRRAEDIGSGYVHPAIMYTAKFITAIAGTILSGYIIEIMVGSCFAGFNVPLIIAILFSAFVSCMIVEIICAGNMKCATRKLWHAVPVAIAAILVFAVYKEDLTGYDTYLPDSDKVESAAFYSCYSPRDYINENDDYEMYEEHFIHKLELTNIEDVKTLAAIGQSEIREMYKLWGDEGYIEGYTPEYTKGYDTAVFYRMKNGRYVVRSLFIPEDIDEDLMNAVIGTNEYRSCLYDLESAYARIKDNSTNGVMSYNCGYGVSRIDADEDMFREFKESYEADLVQYDYTLAHNNDPIGSLEYNDSQAYTYYASIDYYFEIYPEYTHTIEFLKEHDLYLDSDECKDDISGIDLYYTECDETGACVADYTAMIEDPGQIDVLVDKLHIIFGYQESWKTADYSCSATIYFKQEAGQTNSSSNITSDDYYGYGFNGFYIAPEDIPEDVMDILLENPTYYYETY
ncbi:MAG: hypothetical protein J5509_06755 [Lachnospiraceae bacterium]|nr:hypothetical protein [Lachnospiraceae bacterium]